MPKKVHYWTGIVFLVIFLLSGLYMKWGFPELYDGNQTSRMMFRANHIYLLLAALINILFSFSAGRVITQKSRKIINVASVLIILSPLLLLIAFVTETQSLQFERSFTLLGIVSVLSGVLIAAIGYRLEKRKSND